MKVDIFIPCFIDQIYPNIAFSVIKILKKLNIEVNYPAKQTCCGQLAFNSGYWKEAKNVAEKFIYDFSHDRPIVCPSASCAGFIRNYYPDLFKDSILFENSKKLASNIYELTDFLVNYLNITDLNSTFNKKVTYHSACTALREYGIKKEPVILLQNVKDIELVMMDDNDTCCGFGGTFSVKNNSISSAMAQQKINNAVKTGAEYIVSTEASCLINLDGYIKKNKLDIKIIHIADILSQF